MGSAVAAVQHVDLSLFARFELLPRGGDHFCTRGVMVAVCRVKRGYNSRVEWWMWLAGGLVLLLIELATPSGFFVMFFGLGAISVGALQALGIMNSALLQWLVFTVLSVVYLLAFRGRMQKGIDRPPANIDTLIGEIAFPRERILPGQVGRVDLRGTTWNARNDAIANIEVGQRCRVTRVDGLLVYVQPE